MKNQKILFFVGFILLMTVFSCTSEKSTAEYGGTVIQHILDDPPQLNPCNTADNSATGAFISMMQPLIGLDYKSNDIVPVLATETPTPRDLGDGKLALDFEIRPEAVWDNGEPITAADVAFNIKLMKFSLIDNKLKKAYFEFIQDIEIDETNPKKFSLICNDYFSAVPALTGLLILPMYAYDPDNVLGNYSIKQFATDSTNSLEEETVLQDYATFFNGPKFQNQEIYGSGAYKFTEWQPQQRIIVRLKDNWWGHQLASENHWFEAFPKELIWERVNDLSTAVGKLKREELDVMRAIPADAFLNDLPNNAVFDSSYNTFTPPSFFYDYMGINLRDDRLGELAVRKALAHTVDADQVIQTISKGLGEKVASFVHPTITKRLNPNVKPYPHDLAKAKAILKEAGWADSNNDGILDKTIDGKNQQLEFSIVTNAGNKRRETMCMILKENAKDVGIKINLDFMQWPDMQKAVRTGNFDLVVSGWGASPLESDPKQHWHTESITQGSNYVGFSNIQVDSIIDVLRVTREEEKRNEMYKEIHQILHDEIPYVFLLTENDRMAIHNRFDNAYGTGIRPGYWSPGFKMALEVATAE